jgi:hypothetical protein
MCAGGAGGGAGVAARHLGAEAGAKRWLCEPGPAAGGESFLRVYWVAVPEAVRARRVNRRARPGSRRRRCWGGGAAASRCISARPPTAFAWITSRTEAVAEIPLRFGCFHLMVFS